MYNQVLLAEFAAKHNLTLFQLVEYWNFFDEDAPEDVYQAYQSFFQEFKQQVDEAVRLGS